MDQVQIKHDRSSVAAFVTKHNQDKPTDREITTKTNKVCVHLSWKYLIKRIRRRNTAPGSQNQTEEGPGDPGRPQPTKSTEEAARHNNNCMPSEAEGRQIPHGRRARAPKEQWAPWEQWAADHPPDTSQGPGPEALCPRLLITAQHPPETPTTTRPEPPWNTTSKEAGQWTRQIIWPCAPNHQLLTSTKRQ